MGKNVYLAFAVILLGIIFYLSVIPGKVVEGPTGFDKIEHFFAYFLLALLIFLASKKACLSFFMAGIYGFLIEALQFTLPYRSFSVLDALVNFLGAAVLFVYIFVVQKHLNSIFL